MEFLYPFFIAFLFVFLSELGDKTQLLVLSFSAKVKSYIILLGVALGSFFSHGIAILFGSVLGGFENVYLHVILKFITYLSFIGFGVITLWHPKKEVQGQKNKKGLLNKLSRIHVGYLLMIAFSIAIGELGDKTFLASLGLGIQYPTSKLYLILGAILGMVISDALALMLGKFLSTKVSEKTMNTLSGIIFLLFGVFGFISFFSTFIFTLL